MDNKAASVSAGDARNTGGDFCRYIADAGDDFVCTAQ